MSIMEDEMVRSEMVLPGRHNPDGISVVCENRPDREESRVLVVVPGSDEWVIPEVHGDPYGGLHATRFAKTGRLGSLSWDQVFHLAVQAGVPSKVILRYWASNQFILGPWHNLLFTRGVMVEDAMRMMDKVGVVDHLRIEADGDSMFVLKALREAGKDDSFYLFFHVAIDPQGRIEYATRSGIALESLSVEAMGERTVAAVVRFMRGALPEQEAQDWLVDHFGLAAERKFFAMKVTI